MVKKYIQEWFYLGSASPLEVFINEDFPKSLRCPKRPVIFELHSHNTCNDVFLSSSAVMNRAYRNGVSCHGEIVIYACIDFGFLIFPIHAGLILLLQYKKYWQ